MISLSKLIHVLVVLSLSILANDIRGGELRVENRVIERGGRTENYTTYYRGKERILEVLRVSADGSPSHSYFTVLHKGKDVLDISTEEIEGGFPLRTIVDTHREASISFDDVDEDGVWDYVRVEVGGDCDLFIFDCAKTILPAPSDLVARSNEADDSFASIRQYISFRKYISETDPAKRAKIRTSVEATQDFYRNSKVSDRVALESTEDYLLNLELEQFEVVVREAKFNFATIDPETEHLEQGRSEEQ